MFLSAKLKPVAGTLCLIALLFGEIAHSQPVLSGTGSADDPIIITLDESNYNGTLAIEIDGIDVTGLAVISDNTITISSSETLSSGQHTLILYLLSGDSFTIVGEWQFSTTGNSIVDSVTFEAVHEVGADRRQNGDTDTHATSTGEVVISLFDGRGNAGANYVATTIPEQQINGNPIDLGEYYLEFHQTTNSYDLITRLGHQGVDFDDTIISDIRRRGMSVNFETTSQRTFVGVFATQASETLGYENFTGLGTADDRMAGASVALEPFANNDIRFGITGYQGRGQAYFGSDIGEGDGIALSISGSFNDGRLRYALSGGQTNWDEDAEGLVYDNITAQTLRASLDYDVFDPFGANGDQSLTVGVRYEQTKDGFFSLANPGMPAAHQTIGVSANYNGAPWSLSFNASYQRTNFGGPTDLETDGIINASLNGTYTPFTTTQAPRWAGDSPMISFGLGYDGQNRLITPAAAIPQQDYSYVYGNIDFSTGYENWAWGLGYEFIFDDQKFVGGSDTTIHSVLGNVDWYALDWLTLSGDAIIDFVNDIDGQYVEGTVNLYATAILVPDEFLLSARYSYQGSQGPFGTNGGTFGADLTWMFHPVADLVFSGGIAHGDYASLTPDDPEWFAGIALRVRTNIYK